MTDSTTCELPASEGTSDRGRGANRTLDLPLASRSISTAGDDAVEPVDHLLGYLYSIFQTLDAVALKSESPQTGHCLNTDDLGSRLAGKLLGNATLDVIEMNRPVEHVGDQVSILLRTLAIIQEEDGAVLQPVFAVLQSTTSWDWVSVGTNR